MIDKQAVYEFIGECKTSFIASVDEDGCPNMKAMLAPRKIEDGALYFTTNTSSMRVKQYMTNEKASAYFYKRGRFKYEGVMLTGKMQVLTDEESKREIWRAGDTMFYKGGVTDPDYCVLKFSIEKCRRYCDFKNEWVDVR